MTMTTALILLTPGTPLLLLLACIIPQVRVRMLGVLVLAPLPALAATLYSAGASPAVLDLPGLTLTLALDIPGALLLGPAALLWIGAGIYAARSMRGNPDCTRFEIFWLLTLTGSLGVFLAADLLSFYLTYAFVSLAAYGLVVQDGTPSARRAATLYVNLAVLGEALLLAGFVLLAASRSDGSLLIRDVVAALPDSPYRDATLGFVVAAFALKIAIVPGHVWMPLTYRAAPTPASAALSGAGVKAGVIGLIRFLPFTAGLPGWGDALVVFGFFTAFYGVFIGLTQRHPKTILAYSSISQMGVIAAAIGLTLATPGRDLTPVAFYAAHHVLVKGSLFLAIGVAAVSTRRLLWPVIVPAAIIALGLGGLPLTGGMLAKLALKDTFGDGLTGALNIASAAGTTLLMLHFLRHLASTSAASPHARPPAGLMIPWLALAVAAVAVPWALFPETGLGTFADAMSPHVLWASLWPMLIGAALFLILRRLDKKLPYVPAGDILIFGGALVRAARTCGDIAVQGDEIIRRWTVAGLSLLAVLCALGAALVAGR